MREKVFEKVVYLVNGNRNHKKARMLNTAELCTQNKVK